MGHTEWKQQTSAEEIHLQVQHRWQNGQLKIWGCNYTGCDCKDAGGESEETVCENGMPFTKDKLQDAKIKLEHPNFVNAARKTTDCSTSSGEGKKPKDYSRSQVDYEPTRSWHCKTDTYHSETHQREHCLQVIHWEIHCLHLLQQDRSWKIMSLEHCNSRWSKTDWRVQRTTTGMTTALGNRTYKDRAMVAEALR